MPLFPTTFNRHLRLEKSVRFSRRRMSIFRENRKHLIREMVGSHYSDDGTRDRRPVPLLGKGMKLLSRLIASNSPRVLVNTPLPELNGYSRLFELGLNRLLELINLDRSQRQFVESAILSMGVMKVGMAQSGEVEIDGARYPAGQPFADVVSMDDWVHDMDAKQWESVRFAGNRELISHESLRQSPFNDQEVVDRLKGHKSSSFQEGGDERAASISRGDEFSIEGPYKDEVEIWNICLPDEGVLLTFGSGPGGGIDGRMLLREAEWSGPDRMPYYRLGFTDVVDQVMPLGPATEWLDLHFWTNIMFNKFARQAMRTKRNTLVAPNAEDDGKALRDAKDGEYLVTQNPQASREVQTGGLDQAGFAFMLEGMKIFNAIGPNFDLLSGSAAQSPTLGQDQILNQNAGVQVGDMEERFVSAMSDVIKALAWYLMYNPTIDLPLTYSIGGMGVPVRFTPEMRRGEFLHYNFEIVPFSMRFRGPGEKLQALIQYYVQFLLPREQILMQRGDLIDDKRFAELYARFQNMPEIKELILHSQGPVDPQRPIGQPPVKQTSQADAASGVAAGRSIVTDRGQQESLRQILLAGGREMGDLRRSA